MKINFTNALFALLAVPLFTGCYAWSGPPEVHPIVNIEPNQTAFVVKLTGDNVTGQGKFMSEEFLNAKKIATKQIELPVRKHIIGRHDWEFEWVPDAKVILVDRTPVTREWTKPSSTGTSASNQAIGVESKDSINFRVGVNVTASVTEENAAKFLYHFAGKPLAAVMDENVRGFAQTVLAREFGDRELEKCKTEKSAIFAKTSNEIKEHFIALGVTIDNFGSSEGLAFDEPKIQEAINRKISAEMDVQVALQEQTAQETRNKIAVAKAMAAREQAEEFAKAQEAQTKQIELEIAKIRAQAMLTAAQRWSGTLPASVLPSGSPLLFGLDTQHK